MDRLELLEEMLGAHKAAADRLRRQLEEYTSGRMRSGQRVGTGPWVDTTAQTMSRLRDGIAEYEKSAKLLESLIAKGS
jgi:hypothetical protein